jgi:F-type H+-transporting ATPase subunit a
MALMNPLLAAASHPHKPDAMHHVGDETGFWTFFDSPSRGALGIPLWEYELPSPILGMHKIGITKFMLLELIAALLLIVIFVPLCRRAARGGLPRGPFWNAFESLLTFIRDQVARPNLGEHDADRFVPFLWTLFLFILFCNLLGMLPFMASPTASIWVTGAMALIAFIMLHAPGIVRKGPIGYFVGAWPHIDVPYVGWLFSGGIFAIEMMGTVIKSVVLAVRLFANMFAGHMVLATILIFIWEAANVGVVWLFGMVTVASVLGVVGLSLLELFVAFLQAYIFTFLTALFMGMALHPEH